MYGRSTPVGGPGRWWGRESDGSSHVDPAVIGDRPDRVARARGPPVDERIPEEVAVASRALAVWQNRKVVSLLVRRDLKVKYQQSILGYAWSMLEPLAMAGVYFFVFGMIFQTNRGVPGGDDAPGGYLLFLISGLLPWLWFSGGLGESPRALITHSKLITTMKVPREIFPLS